MARRISIRSRPRGSPSGRGGSRVSLAAARLSRSSSCALGLLEILPALATFGGALGIAAIAILFAFAAFVVIWLEGWRGMGAASLRDADRLALLAYPAYLGIKAYRLPPINDITTDPIDPPRYEALARLRPREANPVAYAGPLRRRAAARGLSRHRAAGSSPRRRPPTRPRWRPSPSANGASSTQRRRSRPPRGPHRGGGAHADHGLPRRRGGAHPPGSATARVDIRSSSRYGAAISAPMPRASSADRGEAIDETGAQPADQKKRAAKRRTRRRRRRRATVRRPGAPIALATPASRYAVDRRRALGRDRAARDQILQVRQHGIPGRRSRAADRGRYRSRARGRDVGLALGQPMQDRGLAGLAVPDVVGTKRGASGTRRRGREDRSLRRARELGERGHVVAHGAVRRRHDRGRPRHHVIAEKRSSPPASANAMWLAVWPGVATASMRPARAVDDLAVVSAMVGPEIEVGAASMRGRSPTCSGRAARCGPSA